MRWSLVRAPVPGTQRLAEAGDGMSSGEMPSQEQGLPPQRSNSLDYLNFEEKRQLIASSLSLTDFIHCGPPPAKEAVTAINTLNTNNGNVG